MRICVGYHDLYPIYLFFCYNVFVFCKVVFIIFVAVRVYFNHKFFHTSFYALTHYMFFGKFVES